MTETGNRSWLSGTLGGIVGIVFLIHLAVAVGMIAHALGWPG